MKLLSRRPLEVDLPPNVPVDAVKSAAQLGLAAGTILSVADFSGRYSNARQALYVENGSANGWTQVLIPGARITPYSQMIGLTLLIFAALAALALASAALMYASFYQGGRSIYLLRRLPDRRRTTARYLWSVPLQLVLLAVTWCLVLLVVYYLFWRFCTPAQCLVPPFDGLFPTVVYD
jgi:hypothetical protein